MPLLIAVAFLISIGHGENMHAIAYFDLLVNIPRFIQLEISALLPCSTMDVWLVK